jgi:hypothetical protein
MDKNLNSLKRKTYKWYTLQSVLGVGCSSEVECLLAYVRLSVGSLALSKKTKTTKKQLVNLYNYTKIGGTRG